MKLNLLMLIIGILSFQSCLKDTCKSSQTYLRYDPIYKKSDEIRNLTISLNTAKSLKNPGKIYAYNNFLLINEINEGIHIIDNSNPSSPINKGFIEIPGNIDMAIQNNILYVDNYIDLLSIDISNIQNPVLLSRKEEVFPALQKDPDKGFMVGYDYTKVNLPCNTPESFNEGVVYFSKENAAADNSFNPNISQQTGVVPITGIGGSMARFTITANHLYTVDNTNMKVFQLTNPERPTLTNTINIGWGIETIFPYKDKLFIGSNTGMFIYSISNPSNPIVLSNFTHARACDPVFATDTRAYITLRQGSNCNRANDELDVVDISNILNPKLIRSYPMYNPRGLSVDDNTLYLCDDGFKVYDIKNELTIDDNKLSHIRGFDTYDVIHFHDKNIAMIVGKDGLYQYDTKNPKSLALLSKIAVVR